MGTVCRVAVASLHLEKKQCQEIRVRIAVEMALNHIYGDANEMARITGMTEKEQVVKHLILFSDATLPGGSISQSVIENAYAEITMQSIKDGSYMGMWELIAMASVLGCSIQSVYPTIGSSTVRKFLNRKILPRIQQTTDVATIMWSRANKCVASVWNPNHFLPLVPMVEDSDALVELLGSPDEQLGASVFNLEPTIEDLLGDTCILSKIFKILPSPTI